tara:strand:- start:11428 stop:11562 length:135 start_codon:yes stop_codon:yes gene_type:complete
LIEDETLGGEGRAKQDARAENSYSIIEINNAEMTRYRLARRELC